MAKGWIWLMLTIALESGAVLLLRFSGQKGQPVWSWLGAACYGASFYFLHLALKSLPAGIANAVWAGSSAVLVALAGWWLMGEKLSTVQWVSLGLIAAGLVGMQWNGGK